jgi:hypothetical protein
VTDGCGSEGGGEEIRGEEERIYFINTDLKSTISMARKKPGKTTTAATMTMRTTARQDSPIKTTLTTIY